MSSQEIKNHIFKTCSAISNKQNVTDAKTLLKLRNNWDELFKAAADVIGFNFNLQSYELAYYDEISTELTSSNYEKGTVTIDVKSPIFQHKKDFDNSLDNYEIVSKLKSAFECTPEHEKWGKKMNDFPWSYSEDIDKGNLLQKSLNREEKKYLFSLSLINSKGKKIATKEISYTVAFFDQDYLARWTDLNPSASISSPADLLIFLNSKDLTPMDQSIIEEATQRAENKLSKGVKEGIKVSISEKTETIEEHPRWPKRKFSYKLCIHQLTDVIINRPFETLTFYDIDGQTDLDNLHVVVECKPGTKISIINETQRLAEEKAAEEARIAEEKRLAEEQRLAKEKELAEQRAAEEKATAERKTTEEKKLQDLLDKAQSGDAEAQVELGLLYFNGGEFIAKDYANAFAFFSKAAEQGNTIGMNGVGVCLQNGYGVQKNEKEAVKYFNKGAKLKNVVAYYNLGQCYYNGIGVKKGPKKAVKFYTLAAELGYAPAQYGLGICYRSGEGVKQDYTEAVKWFLKAAEQGNADAQYALGFYYYVKGDSAEAIKWYSKAAKQGHKASIEKLSELGVK